MAAQSQGRIRIGPGILYTTNLKRFMEHGWARDLPPASDNERRLYRLASAGKAALAYEINRLDDLIRHDGAGGDVSRDLKICPQGNYSSPGQHGPTHRAAHLGLYRRPPSRTINIFLSHSATTQFGGCWLRLGFAALSHARSLGPRPELKLIRPLTARSPRLRLTRAFARVLFR